MSSYSQPLDSGGNRAAVLEGKEVHKVKFTFLLMFCLRHFPHRREFG